MRRYKLIGATLIGIGLLSGTADRSAAWPAFSSGAALPRDLPNSLQAVRAKGKSVNVNRNTNVNRSVNRNTNVNVKRTTNVNVNVRRPVRVWAPRPYYGAIVGGVALGTVIAVSAVGAVPAVPAPNMCWFWADSTQMSGYWDYCQAP